MVTLLDSIKALGDVSRLGILWMLEDRKLCVCEIQEALALAQSTVSRHLTLLETAGFVVSEKEGPWKNYRLNPFPPPQVHSLLSVVRMSAYTEPGALEIRERAKFVCRENICGKKSV